MQQKSGMDLLNELIAKLNTVEQKLDVLDHNVKHIANTTNIADLVTKAKETPAEQWVVNHGTPNRKIKDEIASLKDRIKKIQDGYSTSQKQTTYQTARLKLTEAIKKDVDAKKEAQAKGTGSKVMLRGKATTDVSGKKVNISLAEVTVFTKDGQELKSVKANMAGEWSMVTFKNETGETELHIAINGKYKGVELDEQVFAFIVNQDDKEVVVSLDNVDNYVAKGLKPRAKNKSSIKKEEHITDLSSGHETEALSGLKVHLKGRAFTNIDGIEVPLSLAMVTILSEDGYELKTVKTNNSGEWNALVSKNDEYTTNYIIKIDGKYKGNLIETQVINATVSQDEKEAAITYLKKRTTIRKKELVKDLQVGKNVEVIAGAKVHIKGHAVSDVDGKNILLSMGQVTIKDAYGTVIKTTKTNAAGQWSVLLSKNPEGQTTYFANITAKHNGANLEQNIQFIVNEDDKEIQLTNPDALVTQLADISLISNSKIYARGKAVIQVDGKDVPVSMATVKIYDDKDKLVKETKTNMSGEWNLLLPKKSGEVTNYVAEITGKYKGKAITPQNITFVVKDNDKEVRV